MSLKLPERSFSHSEINFTELLHELKEISAMEHQQERLYLSDGSTTFGGQPKFTQAEIYWMKSQGLLEDPKVINADYGEGELTGYLRVELIPPVIEIIETHLDGMKRFSAPCI